MDLKGNKFTHLGHATLLIETPAGKRILIDPWLAGNPKCPPEYHEVGSDAILVTHGHGDHIGDVVTASCRCSGKVIAIVEVAFWLGTQGVERSKLIDMNKGGTAHLSEVEADVTMTDARHTSSNEENGRPIALGEPAGYVISLPAGLKVYVAGDTCAFSDMALIRELHGPDLAVLPIGDHYTMGPREAALACRLLGVKAVIPYHYGTFPVLTGTPEKLKAGLKEFGQDVEVLALQPGETAA